MFICIRDSYFNGKNYIATVRLGKLDVPVTHKPVVGESRQDIDDALILRAKEVVLEKATQ